MVNRKRKNVLEQLIQTGLKLWMENCQLYRQNSIKLQIGRREATIMKQPSQIKLNIGILRQQRCKIR